MFLIPLALKGVAYRAIGAAALLRRNVLIYGVGGLIVPFIGIKAIDLLLVGTAPCLKDSVMTRHVHRISSVAAHAGHGADRALTGVVYPLVATWGIAQSGVPPTQAATAA